MNNYDLEFNLSGFRQEQKELFDENGKRYGGVGMSNRQAEFMLQLINEMEKEIESLEIALDAFNNGTL
jgi:hypothetical protein